MRRLTMRHHTIDYMKWLITWTPHKGGGVFCLLFLYLCFFSSPLCGEANYWGTTGLIRIPNGRIIEDGDMRFTFSQGYPYRTYAVTMGFLPFLELNGRITELLDQKVGGSGWEKYGNYKDKNADFKLLLLSEGERLPSLSVGVQDFHGTQLFFNEYIAASKKFGTVDYTLGYGGNLFGPAFKKASTKNRELDGMFAGIEWKMNPNISLELEYDPTEKLAHGNKEEIKSHYNFGVKWTPFQWLGLGYSFQRGNEHSFYLTLTYPFGKPLLPQKTAEPFYGPVNRTPLLASFAQTEVRERLSQIQDYLLEEGFSNVSVSLSENTERLYVEYENRKYFSQVKGLGRILRIVSAQAPMNTKKVHVIIKQEDIPMTEVSLNPRDFVSFLNAKISLPELLERTEITSFISGNDYRMENGTNAVGKKSTPAFSSSFEPVEIESYFNDPSGFYKARVGSALSLSKELGNGLSVETYLRFPFFSNVATNLSPISNKPIRSDIVDYLENTEVIVEDLAVNKVSRLGNNGFYRITAGFLELQFAGISAEYLKTFKEGRFGLGGEITWSQKRDPDSAFGLKNFTSITPFINGYMYVPELDTTLQASFGRFLAGDNGIRLQITRYIRGGSVFLWYAKSDTTGFTGPNKDYADKGVGFVLPINIFKDKDCQGSYGYSFSPWSRDVGQKVDQVYSLYDFIFKFTPSYITSHWQEISE